MNEVFPPVAKAIVRLNRDTCFFQAYLATHEQGIIPIFALDDFVAEPYEENTDGLLWTRRGLKTC